MPHTENRCIQAIQLSEFTQKGDEMNRQEFLKRNDVAEFIKWLIKNLPRLNVALNIAKSRRFVPNGLRANCVGIEAVLPHYSWMGAWAHNKILLNNLSRDLRNALDENNEDRALHACLGILKWGGVRGAVSYLQAKANNYELVAYLNERKRLFDLTGDQRLEDLSVIDKFDAGMTKIYSLLDTTGSPIYDSRVGAAMAMLYQCYLQSQPEQMTDLLNFPSGSARGGQVRDPGKLGEPFFNTPQFYTSAVAPHDWARFQLKLGWIIREILSKTQWFRETEGEEDADRSRAFEACLFMIGYDLRSIADNTCCGSTQVSTSPKSKQEAASVANNERKASRGAGWVPTGHTFTEVINHFLQFRKTQQPSYDLERFRGWLPNNYTRKRGPSGSPIKPSTAKAYLFPLGEQEFDLVDRSLEDLECIVEGGQRGLECAVRDRALNVDERAWVCLVDAWIVGQLHNVGIPQRDNILFAAGFAGTKSACGTILSVGQNVGKHFGLLDMNGCPTPLYEKFFTEEMMMDDELEILNRARHSVLGG